MYRLDGVITDVYAAHVVSNLGEEKPEGAENQSGEQLAFARRSVLSSTFEVPGLV